MNIIRNTLGATKSEIEYDSYSTNKNDEVIINELSDNGDNNVNIHDCFVYKIEKNDGKVNEFSLEVQKYDDKVNELNLEFEKNYENEEFNSEIEKNYGNEEFNLEFEKNYGNEEFN